MSEACSQVGLSGQAAIPLPDFGDTALFLDFDGTLVDIASRPDGVTVPSDLGDLLRRLQGLFAGGVTMISGRGLSDLTSLLGGHEGNMIGSHGAEWRRGSETWTHPFAGSPEREQIVETLKDWAQGRSGLIVEEKATGVVVHYRQVPEAEGEVEERLRAVLQGHQGLELHRSKMALEVRPDDIGKDRALRETLEVSGAGMAVMIGDDATDEPAMAIAQDGGGMAIKVGEGESVAGWRLKDPAQVRALLWHWAKLEAKS